MSVVLVRNIAVGGGCDAAGRQPAGVFDFLVTLRLQAYGYVADWLVAGHAGMKVGSACSGLQFEFDRWGGQEGHCSESVFD